MTTETLPVPPPTLTRKPLRNIVGVRPVWREFVGIAWMVAFLAVFFAQELPNNHVERLDLAAHVPFALLDAIDPPATPGSPRRGLMYLGQRFSLWAVAALIAAGAWGLGAVLLRLINISGLDRWERLYFSLMLGFCGVSLITLGVGYLGWLSPALFVSGFAVLFAIGVGVSWRAPSDTFTASTTIADGLCPPTAATLRNAWWLWAALPFLIAMLLGSATPPTDFDVKEYHLCGPKEWFLAGRIDFLPHNVYTSFPFLTEMLLLAGMVVTGDWYWGGVAGQCVLMLFAPLTALGLWNAGRRWWSPTVGSFAALVYLSTPWVYRFSIIAYSEGGLAAYVFAGFYVGHLVADLVYPFERHPTQELRTKLANRPIFLAGLMTGAAMAAKYTGLLMAVKPVALWVTSVSMRRAVQMTRALRWTGRRSEIPWGWPFRIIGTTQALFLGGALLAVGPWLVKNQFETGNPVYPLAFSKFGGRGLDAQWAEQWAHAHGRKWLDSVTAEARDLAVKLFDVAAVNDWQSPLMFALLPLAFYWRSDRRRLTSLCVYSTWIFLVWWTMTHHIDRFWLPLLPFTALLAGCGAVWAERVWSRWLTGAVIVGCCVFNFAFCVTGLGGYNAGLTDLNYARDFAARLTSPEVAWLNDRYKSGELPLDAKVLCVGEAELFDAEFPYYYNTVFNRSLLEEWCAPRSGEEAAVGIRDPEEIRATFAQYGVTHVLVNWSEVLRYRTTYGYSEYVHPARFAALQQAGILDSPLALPIFRERPLGLKPASALSSGELSHIERWAPELIVPCGDEQCFVAAQIYPVKSSRD